MTIIQYIQYHHEQTNPHVSPNQFRYISYLKREEIQFLTKNYLYGLFFFAHQLHLILNTNEALSKWMGIFTFGEATKNHKDFDIRQADNSINMPKQKHDPTDFN